MSIDAEGRGAEEQSGDALFEIGTRVSGDAKRLSEASELAGQEIEPEEAAANGPDSTANSYSDACC